MMKVDEEGIMQGLDITFISMILRRGFCWLLNQNKNMLHLWMGIV